MKVLNHQRSFVICLFLLMFFYFSGLSLAQVNQSSPEEIFEIAADSFVFDDRKNQYKAQGNVITVYKSRTLKSDYLIYDRASKKITTSPKPLISENKGSESWSIIPETMEVDLEVNQLLISTFEALIGSKAYLEGRAAIVLKDNTIIIKDAVYSTCKLCSKTNNRLWQIKATRVKIDQTDNSVSFANPVFELMGGIPVLWLPWLQQPGFGVTRQSGILAPAIGGSSSLGEWIELPVFIAVDDYTNLLLKPKIATKAHAYLDLNLLRVGTNGDTKLGFNSVWEKNLSTGNDTEHRLRWSISANGQYKINDSVEWGFGLSAVSDNLFESRYGIPSIGDINRSIYVSGVANHTSLRGEVYGGARVIAADDTRNFSIYLPNIEYSTQIAVPGNIGDVDIDLAFSRLSRNDNSQKLRAGSRVEWNYSMPTSYGMNVETTLGLRSDYINDDNPPEKEFAQQIIRMQPWLSARLSYPMFKKSDFGVHFLDPIVQVVSTFGASRNSEINNDESVLMSFDETSLFRSSMISGWDRVNSGTYLSAGIKYSYIGKNSSVSALVGSYQTIEEENSDILTSVVTQNNARYVLAANYTHSNGNIDFRTELDGEKFSPRHYEVRANLSVGDDIKLSANYGNIPKDTSLNINEQREQIAPSVSWKIGDGWNFKGSMRYNFVEKNTTNSEYSLSYADDCLQTSIIYKTERLNRAVNNINREILFNINLGQIIQQSFTEDANKLFGL